MASSLGKMPATSARRLISLTLELAWIDPEARCVRFSTTKSGAQLRDMGQPALELLLSQPCGRNGSPYVFPANVGDGHFIGVVRVLRRLCRVAELKDVRPHVLRHSVAGDTGF